MSIVVRKNGKFNPEPTGKVRIFTVSHFFGDFGVAEGDVGDFDWEVLSDVRASIDPTDIIAYEKLD